MPWFQVLMFLLRYGLAIMKLVKAIWELVEWIRKRDTKVSVSAPMMRQNLRVMARNAKKAHCLKELEKMRDVLAKRKAELERGEP
jgi:hypothetical protein